MYIHSVKYYETDKMGITHHSNYIRWMEEARTDFFDKLGWSYQKFEEEGIFSPVVSIECKYKHTTTFPEKVQILVSIAEFHGIKLKVNYVMKNQDGVVVCEASSEHCFIDKNGKIVRTDKQYPEWYELLQKKSKK